MPAARPGFCCLIVLAFSLECGIVRADAPADPLRLVPATADLVVKINQPRRLLEAFLTLDATRQALQLAPVRELYDSTNSRRAFGLLAFFEKRLGAGRLDLLDRLAGGGMVLAVKVAPNPPALLVAQGSDQKLAQAFVRVAREVIDQELARQEKKERLTTFAYRGVEGVQAAQNLYLAAAGTALLASNQEAVLKQAIDLHLGSGQNIVDDPGLVEARKLLPAERLAWLWLRLEPIRNLKQVKDAIPTLELNPITAPFVSSWLDAAKRSQFLCASLGKAGSSFRATVRLPRGLEGMAPAGAVYIPQANDAAPPLLAPKNVQISSVYYLDLGRLWEQRHKVLSKEALKGLETFEKNSGRFLGGIKLGKLLGQAGAHQRFVQVNQPEGSSIYKSRPKQPVSGYAVVQEMRDPAFARSMSTILRTAALLAGFQFDLKMVQEKHNGCLLVSYRFPEQRELKGDPAGFRFGFTPTFVQVSNQFVASSSIELARELVDLLQQEGDRKTTSGAAVLARVYSSGLVSQLRSAEEQLVTQLVLGQALSPEEAREQVQALLRLVQGLGSLDLESVYSRNNHRLDLRFDLGK